MKRHSVALLLAIPLLLAACTSMQKPVTNSAPPADATVGTTPPAASPAPAETPAIPAEGSAPTSDAYSLHHRVLPNLLYTTNGQFFAALHAGDFDRFREAIAENYGPGYSKAMRIKSVSLPDIVFITFAEPERVPLCYHVALAKKDGAFTFFTLEKTEDILSAGMKTCFCEWSPDGAHINHGPRKYTSAAEFEQEVLACMTDNKSDAPAAVTRLH